jgi:hypothetical protein
MAWQPGPQDGPLFRALTDQEEEEFREYARQNDPEDLSKWDLYHPICREEWIKRGIKPP